MASILLIIIYVAFISLGLPDSLLGSAWPVMSRDLEASVSWAGVISTIISVGTIVSSLFSGRMVRRLGTGKVTVISVGTTALALMGFSMSRRFWHLCLWAVPYGLGAGGVDSCLNNYVALHYKSRHMSWLHCFWGVGATISPFIMGKCLAEGLSWTSGYQMIGIIQIILTTALFFSLPLWRGEQHGQMEKDPEERRSGLTVGQIFSLPGARAVLITFFCYCALESTAGLWASSYMVLQKGIDSKKAASFTALFYLGITLGRLISGFITEWIGDKKMVRLGEGLILAGLAVLALSGGNGMVPAGLILIGLGCAPIYPSIIHSTPKHFGAENSQSIMGFQIACAYIGSTLMPPFFGILAQHITIRLYPCYLLFFTLLMLFAWEWVNHVNGGKD
ncbi:MAG: MFS transporter [Lachnospiraceae bacterium]|nr:MFS transporter [Lachnospiraceae bacterium]